MKVRNELSATYVWIIDTDHLADDGGNGDAGITGPHDASDELLTRLGAGEGHTFDLYDHDGNHYYTGRLLTDGDMAEERHCFAPLNDFGTGWAGCTDVRWPGHPEWDCG